MKQAIPMTLTVLTVALIGFLAHGCAFDPDTNPPPRVQEVLRAPDSPLSTYPADRDLYVANVERDLAVWDANAAQAAATAALVRSLSGEALSDATPFLESIPYVGTAFVAALGGAVGLFTERPGTKSRIQREREAAKRERDAELVAARLNPNPPGSA